LGQAVLVLVEGGTLKLEAYRVQHPDKLPFFTILPQVVE
jgi:hypothetical protein